MTRGPGEAVCYTRCLAVQHARLLIPMTSRHYRILASLVNEYIEQGEPVSSAWLADHSALGLSSATVRNILARLEEQGLVRQPHTSAGRIPTDSGYRLYVDLAAGRRARPSRCADIEARLRRAGTVGDLLEHASQELSQGLAPGRLRARARRARRRRLQHIDFVQPRRRRASSSSSWRPAGTITHRVDRDDRAVRDRRR